MIFLLGLSCDISLFRFFLSSFSKKENMEKARLLLIQKVKEAIAAPAPEEVGERRCTS